MTLTQEITLDIYDPPYFEYVHAKQADNISRVLIITLTANGETLKPTAGKDTAVFRAQKPDGTCVVDPATVGDDGKVTVALTDQTLAREGRVEADVSIISGDEVLSSATMYIEVARAPISGKQIESSDEFLVMVQATRDAKTAAEDARKAAEEAEKIKTSVDTAEAARAQAETERAAAEQVRQSAEQTRQAEHEAAMGDAGEATQQAADAAALAKELAEHPDKAENGTWWRWDLEQHAYVDTGERAALNYDVTYSSVAEMEADAKDQKPGTVAIISTDVNVEDNAKTYVKRQDGTWGFLADLSGFPGVGIESITQTAGDHSPGTSDTYTIKLTDGRQIAVEVYNGKDSEVTLERLNAAVETAKSRSWDVTVSASGWAAGTDSFAGIAAKWKQTVKATGMAEETEVCAVNFVSGDYAATSGVRWYLRPGTDAVTFWAPEKTAADFTLRLTEVR